MARIAGRNTAMAWTAGVICIGVVAALFVLAAPLAPVLAQFAGDLLRSVTG
ncbi:hypothetical protein JOD62_001968 [Microbacterium keratanolyticum]|uniref:hypothetical protein n=1 Tax=Microbacterium keratanolyticum TaxID=67574 RepID=UPI00195A2136|nr:hypothetical protein [Microbacterium keratanolyticum]MBM7469420.1 hypothetical protein [Microbacterium keratanolyticum]